MLRADSAWEITGYRPTQKTGHCSIRLTLIPFLFVHCGKGLLGLCLDDGLEDGWILVWSNGRELSSITSDKYRSSLIQF